MAKTNYSPTFPMYPGDAEAVTPSDTDRFAPSVLFCGTGGAVRVLTAQGSDVTFLGTMPGAVLPVQVVQVFATTTVATMMVRLSSGAAVPAAAIPWGIDGTGSQLRDALIEPTSWGDLLGPELAGTLPTPTIGNNAGTTGAWDAGTRTMTNPGATSAGYPRFQFALGLIVGRTYEVTGQLSGDVAEMNGATNSIRLATTGSVNGVPYSLGTGAFSGRAVAAAASIEFITDLSGAESLTITSLSVREVIPGWLLPGFAGARLTGDCRTSVAMEQQADGTWRFAAHNLQIGSEPTVAMTAEGTTPPTVGVGTLNGKSAVTVTFDQTMTATYAGSRARQVSPRIAAIVAGATYIQRARIHLSRALTGGEALLVYWTGTQAGNAIALNSSTSAAYTVADGALGVCAANTYTASGTVAPYVYLSGTLSSPVTITMTEFQMNNGSALTTYVPTSNTATRFGPAIDWLTAQSAWGVRGASAATNLALYSADMSNAAWTKPSAAIAVTADHAASPTGATDADLIYPTGSVAWSWLYNSVVLSAGTVYTVSVFAKASGKQWFWIGFDNSTSRAAWFDLLTGSLGTKGASISTSSITSLGNGWYRCVATFSHTSAPYCAFGVSDADNAGNATANGSDGISVWCAQTQTGDRATSPILTYGAAVTQAADTLIDIVDTATAGTLVIDYVPSVAGSQVIAQLDDTTANERHRVMNDGIYDVVDGGVSQASVDGGTPTVGALNRIAVTWQANRFAVSLNGGPAIEDLSGTVPTTTRMLLAVTADAHIVRQRLVSGQAVNISQLQALSA